MTRTTKQVIAIVISILVLGVAAYGSYLPMRKAQIFIATLQGLQSSPVSSLNELQTRLAVPLDYPSPIGQEELVRNTANNILGFISQGADPTSTAVLVSFLANYYDPIIARGKGMSFCARPVFDGCDRRNGIRSYRESVISSRFAEIL